jgi:hypothetical protein
VLDEFSELLRLSLSFRCQSSLAVCKALVGAGWGFVLAFFSFAPSLFHKLVEFMQIDVRENWACYTALGGTDKALLLPPMQVEIPCVQKFSDEVQETFILNLLA